MPTCRILNSHTRRRDPHTHSFVLDGLISTRTIQHSPLHLSFSFKCHLPNQSLLRGERKGENFQIKESCFFSWINHPFKMTFAHQRLEEEGALLIWDMKMVRERGDTAEEESAWMMHRGKPVQCETLASRDIFTNGLCKSYYFIHILIPLTEILHKSLPLVPGWPRNLWEIMRHCT